jgi:DNA-binding CsgD family transcriptional regulator/tetratricopeptide (TPR) repeat protein
VPVIRLRGRTAECAALDQLLAAAQAGRSQVLVLRGEAGVGKTALLDYLRERAAACRVIRAAGIESEMELPFAGVHQLCAPLLDRLEHLPGPQRAALATAFGLDAGAPPDRFLVGLAVLSLLAEVAEEEPVVCVVDDAQWLDRVSAQTLGFVARRLLAERLALVFALRGGADHELDGLSTLVVRGLGRSDARALLDSVVRGPIDDRVRERIVAETRGNPLALLELTRGLGQTELAGGFGLLETMPLTGRIEEGFVSRLGAISPEARRLVLAAAAEPVGDVILLWRALEQLGIPADAAAEAEAAGLVELDTQVRFRHPLVRSAVYRAASAEERAEVHRALAEATDPEVDPDRRAWHRAAAATAPDEDVALELERSASRAQARGGLAAAAAFLQRAVMLTEPMRRTERALNGALASLHAGAFDPALGLLAVAETGSLDELQRARTELLRGQIAFASSVGSAAPPLLLRAAKRLEPLDSGLARETYLDAWGAALFAGRLATSGGLLEVSRAAKAAPPPTHAPRPSDLLLDGLATLVTEGRTVAAPALRQAASAFAAEGSAEENFRWGWLATVPSNVLWDDETLHAINARQLRLAREVGALVRLPIDLTALAVVFAWWGDLAGAASAIAEADAVTEATGTRIAPYGAMLLAALRGREAEAASLIESTTEEATAGGQGIGVQFAQWVAAVLFNGLGRYEQALAAAQEATDDEFELFLSAWALPELIEASVKIGRTELASAALERLAKATAAAGTEWASAIEARSRALVGEGRSAEAFYQEAIERFGRTQLRPELARAHLLYGEWLRGENRSADARAQLHTAHDLLSAIGMEAFAERARIELLSTGEKVRRPSVERRERLTSKEAQIARLAREGLSNPEIGARLFLSHRTIEWHLHKIFAKLGVSSRRELRNALPDAEGAPVPA